MPQLIIDYRDESDNPFRPEGNLAKEADEFIKELKTKNEEKVNDIIKNAGSLNNSASLSVSEIIHHANESEKKIETTNDSNLNTSASSPVKLKSDEKQDNVNGLDEKKQSDNVNLPSPTKTETKPIDNSTTNNDIKTENEKAKKNKKVKSKCGCVIS